jgi:hypothetical protein
MVQPYHLVCPDRDTHEEQGYYDLKVGSLYCPTDLMKVMSEYVSEVFPHIGWQESHYWANWRLLLCAAGCAFASWGHFMCKFPEGAVMLGLCVLSYFVLSACVTVLDHWVLRSSVVSVFPPSDCSLPNERIFIDISMDRFDSEITFTVRNEAGKNTQKRGVCASKFFTEDGWLECEHVFAEIGDMLRNYYGKDRFHFDGKPFEAKKTK